MSFFRVFPSPGVGPNGMWGIGDKEYLKIQLEALRGGRAVSLDTFCELYGPAHVWESLCELLVNCMVQRMYVTAYASCAEDASR